MVAQKSGEALSLSGAAAPPMANGEVIFEAPWQSRVFGLARFLCEAGHYSWDEFRERLIAEVAAAEQAKPEAEFEYFECFLGALTELLTSKGLCDPTDLIARETAFYERPHGHDH